MRLSVGFELGIRDEDMEYTAEFTWDTGGLPMPRRGERIWLGELIATVAEVRYKCADAASLAMSGEAPVEGDLWLKLSKHARGQYSPAEFHKILAELPSISALYVTSAEQ